MPHSVRCPQCGQQYSVKAELAGKQVKCKKCGGAFRIPASSPSKPEPDDGLSGLADDGPSKPKTAGAGPGPGAGARSSMADLLDEELAGPSQAATAGPAQPATAGPGGPAAGAGTPAGLSAAAPAEDEGVPLPGMRFTGRRPLEPAQRDNDQRKTLLIGGAVAGSALLAIVLIIVYFVSSGSRIPGEDVLVEAIEDFEEMADTLEEVEDAETARAAAPKLQEIAARGQEIQGKVNEIKGRLTPEQDRQLEEKYGEHLEAAVRRLAREVQRVRGIPGARGAMGAALVSSGGPPDVRPPPTEPPGGFGAPHRPGSPHGPGPPHRPWPSFHPGHPRHPKPSDSEHFRPLPELWQEMVEKHGLENCARVRMTGCEELDVFPVTGKTIREFRPEGFPDFVGRGRGDLTTLMMAPMSDLDALAAVIDFGTVTKIDREERTVYVTADRSKFEVVEKLDLHKYPDRVDRALAQLKSRHEHLRRNAVGDLSRLPFREERQEEVLAVVLPRVSDEDANMRRAVARALGIWHSDECIPELIRLAEDEDVNVRHVAIESLGQTQDRRAAEALAALLPTERRAAGALIKMGPIAEDAVIPLLDHEDDEVFALACDVLKHVGTEKVVPKLEPIAHDKRSGRSSPAGGALHWISHAGRPAGSTWVTLWLSDLKSGDVKQQTEAAARLARMRPDAEHREEVAETLVRLLSTDDLALFLEAAEAWGTWHTPETLPAVLALLDTEQQRRLSAVYKALGNLRSARVAELVAARLAQDSHDAENALIEMGKIAEEATIEQLASPHDDARVHACRVLTRIGTSKSLPALQRLLDNKDRAVRGQVESTIAAVRKRQ